MVGIETSTEAPQAAVERRARTIDPGTLAFIAASLRSSTSAGKEWAAMSTAVTLDRNLTPVKPTHDNSLSRDCVTQPSADHPARDLRNLAGRTRIGAAQVRTADALKVLLSQWVLVNECRKGDRCTASRSPPIRVHMHTQNKARRSQRSDEEGVVALHDSRLEIARFS